MSSPRVSRKQQKRPSRAARRSEEYGGNVGVKNNLKIREITPLTENQEKVFDFYDANKHLFLHGAPGTGKSFLSMYLALQEILDGGSPFERLIIVRSATPSKDIGFLPGNQKEKTKVYEQPYAEICAELFGRGDAYELLKSKGVIEFTTTSYLRGITFSNAIVIVDEIQNGTAAELGTVMTRVGENCKIIFCGDIRQNDLIGSKIKSGLPDFMKIIKHMKEFAFTEFGIEDIVRSALVKSFIVARCELEDKAVIAPFM